MHYFFHSMRVRAIVSIVFFAALLVPSFANAQVVMSGTEQIHDYHVEIDIQPDSSLQVTETIEYDFGPYERRGIFRFIPYTYEDSAGFSYKLRIDDVRVTNDTGLELQVQQRKKDGNYHLRIGDPDRTITGVHTYVIDYTIHRGMRFFDEHIELYWNAIGQEWDVPIAAPSIVVGFPESLEQAAVETVCFSGPYHSTAPCSGSFIQEGSMVEGVGFAPPSLGAYEGVTIAVSLPVGTVQQPQWYEQVVFFLTDNYMFGVPVLVLLYMIYRWRKYGRDPKGRGTVITQFDPPEGLSPAEVGTLFDEVAHDKDITAQLIYLAQQGYITITQKPKTEKKKKKGFDYEFTKNKDIDASLATYDRTMLEGIFADNKTTALLSDLSEKYYKTQEKVTSQMYAVVTKRGYFKKNPDTVRSTYIGIGVGLLLIMFFGAGFLKVFVSMGWIVSLVLCILILFGFAAFMPARTKKGVLAQEHIRGLKQYLTVAEKDRMAFHNAPEKNPQLFEKLLPFAIALGVEKQWAEQFKDMHMQPPSWYRGTTGDITAALLVSDLSTFSKTAKSTFTSQPQSSSSSGFGGGGFSGGGFGGGGGGSW